MYEANEILYSQVRTAQGWRRMADVGRNVQLQSRPARTVDYLPMSRVLPAGEYSVVRSAFRRADNAAVETLNASSLGMLSYILGRQYQEVETKFIRGLGLPSCNAGVRYSGFDMGGGECSVISILSRLQRLRTGGLLVIEELELGLHPEAQERLVRTLLGVCDERRIQIVCTTHSEVVLDAIPRQARVLLRRSGGEHDAIDSVSTRFAVHEMAGDPRPELLIYTEDRFASVVVEEALPVPQRTRVAIRDIGSNVTVAKQSIAHLRMDNRMRALSVYDGDCTDREIAEWLRAERAERDDLVPAYLVLPGDQLNPERWILREVRSTAYLADFARWFDCTEPEALAHLEAIDVQPDHHDAGYTLSQRTGIEAAECTRRLVRSVARRHPQLEPLRNRVRDMLDGVVAGGT
jgi:hypothetical protein